MGDDKEQAQSANEDRGNGQMQRGVIKPCLLITLRITDEEVVEAYKDVDKILVLEDIQHGTLSDHCEIVYSEYEMQVVHML